jgi:SAM-dependent methyltransferase
MSAPDTFQIPLEVAETYEARFVPAIFAQWAPLVLDAAGVGPGSRLLDVACGTGIVARSARSRVGDDGAVVGVDLNDAMLTVARRLDPDVDWRQGDAAALPVDDGTFDAVTCQMAMMFFPDRVGALAEMARATRSDGRVAIVVPAGLDQQPAYGPFVEIAARHAGPDARSLLATYWNCGDLDDLCRSFEQAGLDVTATSTEPGTARFASCADFVATEIASTPLEHRIDHPTREVITREVAASLDWIDAADDVFDVPLPCHVVAARPRR